MRRKAKVENSWMFFENGDGKTGERRTEIGKDLETVKRRTENGKQGLESATSLKHMQLSQPPVASRQLPFKALAAKPVASSQSQASNIKNKVLSL